MTKEARMQNPDTDAKDYFGISIRLPAALAKAGSS